MNQNQYTESPLWIRAESLNERIQNLSRNLSDRRSSTIILRSRALELLDALVAFAAGESPEARVDALHQANDKTLAMEGMLFYLLLSGQVASEQCWNISRDVLLIKRLLIETAAHLPRQ